MALTFRMNEPEAKKAEKVEKENQGKDGEHNWRALKPRKRWQHHERAAKKRVVEIKIAF